VRVKVVVFGEEATARFNLQRRVIARETVLSRMGANEKFSQLPIISARDLVKPPGVRSSVVGPVAP
jgi:hypothetical protein